MTSTIHADKIMNSSGDQDSGLDLQTNDQVKLKTANTDRVTVTDSATTVANDLTVGGTDLFVDTSAEKLGIGTATANQLHQKLNIYSSSEAGIQFMNDATGVANSTDGARISVYEDDIQYTNYESAGKQIFNVGTNGGTTAMTIDSSGFVTKPQTPICSVTKDVNSQTQTISGSNYYTLTGMTSGYGNSHSVNNKSYWNTSNSRFEIPSGAPTAFYYCEFNTLFGITRPSSGVNWGFIGIRKNNASGLSNNISAQGYREATNGMGTSTYVYDMMSCSCIYSLAAGDWVEPIFSGSSGVTMLIHAGNYTSFTAMQVG